MKKMTYPKICPSCNSNLEGTDIYETFLEQYKDHVKAHDAAVMYGWTEESPKKWCRAIGVYDMRKDRTSHWQCPDCKHVWER